MPVYSAADIVGHNLVAAKNVFAYKFPLDNSQVLGQFTDRQNIGIVAGYVEADPAKGRNYLYWLFNDVYGQPAFWVRHSADSFHYDSFTQEGLKDVATQLEEENLKNLPWYERLIKQYGPALLIGIGVIVVSSAGVKGYFSRSRK